MIRCDDFYELLKKKGITFYCGVPDSLLKDFCAFTDEHAENGKHLITANEGNAVSTAAGYHLATGEIGVVYMQNSGLGNAVNPLLSLADRTVYGIPMLLLIGWRGEPGVPDEPQHNTQGKIMRGLLETMGIPCDILGSGLEEAFGQIDRACGLMREKETPFALFVRKGTFEPYAGECKDRDAAVLTRVQALRMIMDVLGEEDVVVSTTGKTSRELFECRVERGQGHERDFLSVGSMGHASSIALGIARGQKRRNVWCIDGDGAAIMHMGAVAVIGAEAPGNFKHVLINNGAHESVGGQPTAGRTISFPEIARACGYKAVFRAGTEAETAGRLKDLQNAPGPALLEIRVRQGSRPDLGRPDTSPRQRKVDFMRFVQS